MSSTLEEAARAVLAERAVIEALTTLDGVNAAAGERIREAMEGLAAFLRPCDDPAKVPEALRAQVVTAPVTPITRARRRRNDETTSEFVTALLDLLDARASGDFPLGRMAMRDDVEETLIAAIDSRIEANRAD
jgi:hypothetical protein